jgi:hypothetical protein
MRRFAALLLALTIAAAAAADDGFSLGLVALPLDALAAASEDAVLPATGDMKVELADNSRDALVFKAAFTPSSESEFRLAVWNSPMGRLYYGRAEAMAMLGREGLHGGHSLGIGTAATAVGDYRPRARVPGRGDGALRQRSSRPRPRPRSWRRSCTAWSSWPTERRHRLTARPCAQRRRRLHPTGSRSLSSRWGSCAR